MHFEYFVHVLLKTMKWPTYKENFDGFYIKTKLFC